MKPAIDWTPYLTRTRPILVYPNISSLTDQVKDDQIIIHLIDSNTGYQQQVVFSLTKKRTYPDLKQLLAKEGSAAQLVEGGPEDQIKAYYRTFSAEMESKHGLVVYDIRLLGQPSPASREELTRLLKRWEGELQDLMHAAYHKMHYIHGIQRALGQGCGR